MGGYMGGYPEKIQVNIEIAFSEKSKTSRNGLIWLLPASRPAGSSLKFAANIFKIILRLVRNFYL